MSRYILFAALALGTAFSGCASKDAEGVKTMLEDYWQALFEGKPREAYSMLTRQSRKTTKLDDYAEQMAFGLDTSPAKDSFWSEYSALCNLSMGPVKITDDTAETDIIITYPHMPTLVKNLGLKADSLFPTSDSLARKEWMYREQAKALREHRYMTMAYHLSLRLHWEWFGWYLIFE